MKCLQILVCLSHIRNECDQSKKETGTETVECFPACNAVLLTHQASQIFLHCALHECQTTNVCLSTCRKSLPSCCNYNSVCWDSVSLKTSAELLTIKICKRACIFLQVLHKTQFQWNTILLQFPINVVLNCLSCTVYVYTGLTEQEIKFCKHWICFTVTFSLW
jgi:hypothetical protein